MNGKEKTNGSLAMAPRVITIPATSQENQRKLRVAAYARVSSNSEDQKHSFAAQNAYYSKLITDNPDWELADVYADKGITGTSVEKRKDFLRMMEDCRKGRIDRILVKSSSRFARNAKESLEAVRELKALGVSVYFEEQNIDTAQASGEILTAMFAALAQRESEAISERMRWSYQMRMQKGEFNTCQAPLGFRLNGRALEIIPEEAKIVRRIFVEYLSGNNSREIARELNKDNTLGLIWNHKTIDYILQNERYAGNALLQKRYASNTLPSKMIYNHGERPQYFVSDINDTIVPKEVFDKAQTLRKERNVLQGQVHSKMSSRMRCACGSRIRAKRIHSLWYWVCCRHDEERTCSLMPIQEMQVEQAFLRLYFKLMLHLMRGQIFELEGYRFFTMGGARSHDIEDGILELDDPNFERKLLMLRRKPRARFRINHISWWEQELPSDEEYAEARRNLGRCGWQADYIITHCAPISTAMMESRHNEADELTEFFQEVKEKAEYSYWLFGHYHDNRAIDSKHILLWEQIVQII
ncbi:recombinase family protein [Dysosmobacter sp. Sow4_B12]|uniref:recombinase family protein n=1 Tax=Dysosmobacter sp. Sow4_B12 TaxID=3438777 RepID=UPI003F9343C3